MRKRFLTLIFFMTMCIVLFPSCDSKPKLSQDNPVSLEIWHYYNGAQKMAFDKAVSEFNDTVGRSNGIVVDAYSQGSVGQLIKRVMSAAEKKVGGGELPNIFASYADTAYEVDKLGLVAPLDTYFTESELSEYVPDYMEEGRFDKTGSLKIFPVGKSTEIVIVNKTDWDKFAKATGADVSLFKTVEGITALAKKYYEWTDAATAKPNDGKAFFGRDAMANYLIIGAKQLGNDLVSTDNGKIALNIDRAVMRKLWDNFYVPFISGYFDANGKFRTDDAKTGDIIALVGSTTGASYFPKKVVAADDASYDIDTMVLPLPVFEGGTPYTAQQGAGMVVTKQDELHEIASVMFLKWFTQRDLNIDFTVASGYLPVRRDASDVEIVQKYFKNAGTEQSGKCVEQSVIESINMTKTHKFYSHKPFENSTEVRMILEKSMLSRAKADSHEVEKLIAGGLTHADAVAKLATDKNFNAWLTEFTNEMDSAIGK